MIKRTFYVVDILKTSKTDPSETITLNPTAPPHVLGDSARTSSFFLRNFQGSLIVPCSYHSDFWDGLWC